MFSRSFFADPADLSAAELATMFHIYFLGSSEGLIFDVANAELRCGPVESAAEVPGVAAASRSTPGSRSTGVHPAPTLSGALRRRRASSTPTRVVLATDVAGLRRIVAASAGLGDDGLAAPNRGDCAPRRRSWCCGCGWTGPCDADRAAFLGTGGRPPLDNVSVLERYEREAAQWARRTGGSVVELHAYAVTDAPDGGRATRLLARAARALSRRPPRRRIVDERCCTARTARASRPATSPPGQASRHRIPAWCWPATASASTCRWR